MKIYQVYHDKASKLQCSPSQDTINVQNIQLPQLAESRAFFYAALYDYSEYIGFTTYKHNEKFVKCVRIERITKELVEKCFENKDVKVIAFDPTEDFMQHINLYFKGMDIFINKFFIETFESVPKIKNKVTPLCNSFIMPKSEFKDYFKFLTKFLIYLDDEGFDPNEFKLDIPVSNKNRGWAYVCEMLLSFYLNYNSNFKIAFIDRAEKIHIK